MSTQFPDAMNRVWWEVLYDKHSNPIVLLPTEAVVLPGSRNDQALNNLIKKHRHVYFITGNAGKKVFEHFLSEKFTLINFPLCFFVNYYNYNWHKDLCQLETNFTHHFCCYNNKPRSHRSQLANDLIRSKFCHMCLVTWLSGETCKDLYGNETPDLNAVVPLSVENESIFPQREHNIENMPWHNAMTPPVSYHTCAVDLVTETYYNQLAGTDSMFVTEKTVKPLWHGKLFLVLGMPGIHHWLESKGFILYRNLFDYSFDTIVDPVIRYRLYMKNVHRIAKLTTEELQRAYQFSRAEIEHNMRLARNINAYLPLVIQQKLLENSEFFQKNLDEFFYRKDLLGTYEA